MSSCGVLILWVYRIFTPKANRLAARTGILTMPSASPINQETVVSRSTKSPATPLPDRIARARSEGRTQQALELTRQLFKQSHTSENQELLRQVLLRPGPQMQPQRRTPDPGTGLGHAP